MLHVNKDRIDCIQASSDCHLYYYATPKIYPSASLIRGALLSVYLHNTAAVLASQLA